MSTATAGTAQLIRRPYGRWPVALLVISVALNALFIAGAVWSHLHPGAAERGFEPPYHHMAAQLQLNDQQRADFQRYVATMRTRTDEMREQIAPLIAGAWDQIANPQADQAQVMQRFDEVSQKWREFQRQSTTQTLDFLATLSPEQRSKFVAIIKERRAAHFRQLEHH